MNFISRNASRALTSLCKNSQPSIASAGTSFQSQYLIQPHTRSLVMLSSSLRNQNKHMKTPLCLTTAKVNGMHTKGDRELVEFLQNEISMEKKNLQSVPTKLGDFSVTQDEGVLILKKSFQDETVIITLNVNHSVEDAQSQDENSQEQLQSQPDFEVDIKIGSKTLSLTCQFTPPSEGAEGDHVEDEFGISEVTLYDGEWSDKTYCVAGGILDPMMYDLLMNMLEERGITSEFTRTLSQACTDYEHSLFVKMLEGLQSFIKRK